MRLQRFTLWKQLHAAFFVVMPLAVVCGCGKDASLAEVTGKVTYDGKPVAHAAVEFRPLGDGKQSIGYSDEDGNYELQYTLSQIGALIGRHKIVVRIYPPEGQEPVPVPDKYGSKSSAEFEVKPGSNRFDIELKE